MEEEEADEEEAQEELRRNCHFSCRSPRSPRGCCPMPALTSTATCCFRAMRSRACAHEGADAGGQVRGVVGVDVAATYDDNVAATNDDREDDITGNVGASVGAAVTERHSLGFNAGASIGNPHDNLNQNTVDGLSIASGVNGRLDLTRRSSLSAEATARGAQNPEDEEAGAQEQPTITTGSGAVAYRQRFNRLGWSWPLARPGARPTTATRPPSRTAPATRSLRGGLCAFERVTLFADTAYGINNYDHSGEGGSRDSQTVRADVGAEWGLGRTLSARLGVGYTGVFFEDLERDDRHVPTVTAALGGAYGINLDRLTLLRLGFAPRPTRRRKTRRPW